MILTYNLGKGKNKNFRIFDNEGLKTMENWNKTYSKPSDIINGKQYFKNP